MLKLFDSKSFGDVAESYKKAAPYLNIGYTWAAAVIIFTYVGIKIDDYFGSKPFATLVGAILGVFTGFYQLIKILMSEKDKSAK